MYSVMHNRMIPVVFQDGREEACSIREIFARAHEIRDVKAYSDQARCAVLRLLMAFLMDSHVLETRYDRAGLLDAGRFDIGVLDTYAADCEREGPRFELFDPARPFMQCAYDPATDAKAEKPVAILIPEYASGNNHIFFMHFSEDEHALAPAEALQAMLVTYLFCTAGAQGFPSGVNNTPPVYALIEGENLFQTLVINSLSASECEVQNIPYGRGKVPWRTDETVVPKKLFQNVSLLRALTWRPRRIALKLNPETGMVDRVFLQQGHNFIGNDLWRDPHVPRVKRKDGSYANLKPELGRALWRDAGTLVGGGGESRPPAVAAYVDLVEARGHEKFDLSMTGLATSNASILGATCERLAMPVGLMKDPACARRFVRDLAFLEDAQRVLTKAVAAQMTPDVARQAQELFLERAHDFLFGDYLAEIRGIGAGEDAEDRLFELLKRLDGEVLAGLRAALARVVNIVGSDAAALVRHVSVERIVVGWYYNRKKEREEE